MLIAAGADDNNPRFGLQVSPDGSPALSLQRKGGSPGIHLTVDSSGEARQTFLDADRRTRVSCGIISNGTAEVTVHSAKSKGNAMMQILPEDVVSQTLTSPDGKSKIFSIINEKNALFVGVDNKGKIDAFNQPKP